MYHERYPANHVAESEPVGDTKNRKSHQPPKLQLFELGDKGLLIVSKIVEVDYKLLL